MLDNCPDNASFLADKGRKFIISCSATRPKAIWKSFLHTFVQPKETAVYGPEYACVCFNAKTDSKSKKRFVNFLTNDLELIKPGTISRYNKKFKDHISIETLKIINAYNFGHGYIDAFKARVVAVRNIEKRRRPSSTKLWDLLYSPK